MQAGTVADVGSWRQYFDQLTPEQVEHLEYVQALEYREYVDTPERREGDLLDLACNYVERNRKNAEYAGVPVPAGAEATFDWGPDLVAGEWRRSLVWGEYPTGIEDVYVLVSGMQKPDGTYTRQLGLFVDDDDDDIEMTAEQARTLAAALLNAADDLERG